MQRLDDRSAALRPPLDHLTPRRTITLTALGFSAALVVCCGIAPSGLGGNGGLSDFGGHLETFVPYWAGVWCLAAGVWCVARSRENRLEQLLLRAVGVLLAVIVFTFSSISGFFNATHDVFGSAAFTLCLIVSVYATLRRGATIPAGRRVLARLSLGVEIAAWGLAALWLFEVQGHLLWAQSAFFVSFLANAMAWLDGEPSTTSVVTTS